jgi:dihydrofolate reductase
MRKVTAGLFISLDGVVESPDKWQFDHFDADMMSGMSSVTEAEDTVLLGRVTYQEWAGYWPDSDDQLYGSHINQTPKYIVSTTLEEVDWGKWDKPTLIKSNLGKELARLKRQPGKNIGVAGSPTLVRSMLKDELLDELTLMIHPVVVGKGKRLFEDGGDLKRYKVAYSKATSTGVLIVTYQPRKL